MEVVYNFKLGDNDMLEDYETYTITVNFAGFIGADITYEEVASTLEEAEELAIEDAADDLTIESVEQVDDDEFEVTVGFGGYIGVENSYTVFADSEEDAELEAIEEAKFSDLEIVR